MFAWHGSTSETFKSNSRAAYKSCLRRDVKETLFFPFYDENDVAFSRFTKLWRESDFGSVHLFFPGRDEKRTSIQFIFDTFLGLINDPSLLYRDYKVGDTIELTASPSSSSGITSLDRPRSQPQALCANIKMSCGTLVP